LDAMPDLNGVIEILNGQKIVSFYRNIMGDDTCTVDGHARNIYYNQREGLTSDKTIADMQAKYDVKETAAALVVEEAKVSVMESEKQLSQVRWILIISSGLVIVIGVAIFFYIRVQKHNQKLHESFVQDMIKNIEKERGRIAQDLHDGIGQDLSVLKNRMGLIKGGKYSSSIVPEITSMEEDMSAVIEQTREISRSLFPSYLRKVGIADAISSLLDRTEQSTGIISSYDLPILKVQPKEHVKTHIFRIIQECINNTTKHAQASALKVELFTEEDRWVLIYQDNGKGIETKKKLNGMGMMSMSERVKMMDGQLSISSNESGKGFKLTATFDPQYND
ncbi:MAG: sensor histidine kinase, partial [Flavobacteriales bacterium]|nr:sensor histidine kinase [Flavobacteriales bacterium]